MGLRCIIFNFKLMKRKAIKKLCRHDFLAIVKENLYRGMV